MIIYELVKSSIRVFLKNYNIIKALLIILLFLSLVIFLKPITYDYYPDFVAYYVGTEAFNKGLNPYLVKEIPANFIYPPPALLLLLPFTFVSLSVSQTIFTIFSFFCFFASLFLLFRMFKLSFFSNLGLFILILSLNFFPAKFTLGMGQINNIVLMCISSFIYLYSKNKHFLSGFYLALAISIKLYPILVIPYLIIKNKWRTLFFSMLTITSIALTVYVFVDWKINLFFYSNVMPSLLDGIKTDYYNQALSGFLVREISNTSTVSLIKNLAAVILTSLSFILIFKHRKIKSLDLLCIGTIITLSLIINSFSWQHHFVFILIPLFITFFYIKNNKLNLKYYFILGLSYLLMALNLKNPYSLPIFFQSHVLYGALILYILDMYFLFRFKK